MAASRDDIVRFLDELLDTPRASDFGPNGLQVEGETAVEKVAFGVSASQQLFESGIRQGAHMIVVHHGLFFGAVERLTGLLAKRIRILVQHGVSLVAYHLPLDRHPEVGNTARLCRALGLGSTRPFGEVRGAPVGLIGEFQGPALLEELADRATQACGQRPRIFPCGPRQVQRVAVVTGAGGDLLEEAARFGIEVFITGEAPERVRETCRELGVSMFLCGHDATERFGVQALSEIVAQRFGVETAFIDVPSSE